jgi:alkanesulfonate monooxygenase SsuD/methylene tetrahydromethanopterin reductase-like flavin-dependent oxidoreductase (luciferase family)
VKLGIYLNSQHPASDDPKRRLAETLEQVRLIRSLGFDSIWAGEHHITPGFHFFPQFALLQRIGGGRAWTMMMSCPASSCSGARCCRKCAAELRRMD